jgi:hypothetical protein
MFMFGSGSDTIAMQEFSSKERCEEAIKTILSARDAKQYTFKWTPGMVCVPK